MLVKTMSQVGSVMAGLMVTYTMLCNCFPYELQRYLRKLLMSFYPYLKITISEYQGDGFDRSEAFSQVERYLDANMIRQSKCFQANVLRDAEKNIILTMDHHEEVTEEYKGIKVRWTSIVHAPNRQTITVHPRQDEKRSFMLKFHKGHRDVIINDYLKHVFDEGKAIQARERRRMLYTNHTSQGGHGNQKMWTNVALSHPATFDTLAMDPAKKNEIMDDLIKFSKGKDYYAKIGKAWKRGYLLYGPPGTGKSTMIAAMANLLKYDVYDLELTAVKDNTELRKLLIHTSSKSIIVVEDIDCSLDLTGQRVKKKDENKSPGDKEKVEKVITRDTDKDKLSKVTLSGLLNFIDGLWSACGEERIIVFTTNHMEKLDPALIRRGRMDKHIALSYCGFEAFKCLASNYLDLESHELFPRVKELLEEIKMSPADVAENLMPKSDGEDEESCLLRLVKALEEAKDDDENKKSIGSVTNLAKGDEQEKLANE